MRILTSPAGRARTAYSVAGRLGTTSSGDHAGCDDLLDAVNRSRPALHVFGHIHEAGGFWRHGPTAFANVTTAECSREATVIDYDPVKRHADLVAVPKKVRFGFG